MNFFPVLLVGILVGVSGCTSSASLASHVDNLKPFEVAPFQLQEKVQQGVKLLDVREEWEYQEAHLEGATLLPVGDITQAKLDSLGLQKKDEIVVYCKSGSRSEKAYYILKALGYQNVKSLGGGIVHWEEDGYPVVKGGQAGKPAGALSLTPADYDFGQVPQFGGPVQTSFTLVNTGSSTVEITSITTSCSCTSAAADKSSLLPGETATLTVTFDPNVHEEPKSKFKRTVFIGTDKGEVEAAIWVDILEGV